MSSTLQARFYLHEALRQCAERGDHNFINQIANVLKSAGFGISFDLPENARPGGEDYSLFFMREPFVRNSVSFRRAYYYPFWHIERTNERWYWDVAKARFDPNEVDETKARKFFIPGANASMGHCLDRLRTAVLSMFHCRGGS